MRSTPLWLGLVCAVSSAFSSGLGACTSDTTPVVYIGMAYQLRCLDCQPRAPDSSAHDVRAVDGEAGHDLGCTVNKDGSKQRVTFSVTHESSDSARNYALRVEDARLGADESDGPCEVRLVEGNNTYTATCGSDEPTDERPCQVSLARKGDVVKGRLYCKRISNQSNVTLFRYLVAPNTQSDPAEFELYGCRGL